MRVLLDDDDVVEWIVIDFRRFIGVNVVVDNGIQRKVHVFIVVTVALQDGDLELYNSDEDEDFEMADDAEPLDDEDQFEDISEDEEAFVSSFWASLA